MIYLLFHVSNISFKLLKLFVFISSSLLVSISLLLERFSLSIWLFLVFLILNLLGLRLLSEYLLRGLSTTLYSWLLDLSFYDLLLYRRRWRLILWNLHSFSFLLLICFSLHSLSHLHYFQLILSFRILFSLLFILLLLYFSLLL